MTRRLLVAAALVAVGLAPNRPQASPQPSAEPAAPDHPAPPEASRSRPYSPPPSSSSTTPPPTSTTRPTRVAATLRPPSSAVEKPEHPQPAAPPATGYGPADLGRFRVTCYGPPQFPAGKHTATGAPVGPGSVAVDRRIIPLGTRLHLDGIGDAVADDTGGAVKGKHLDLWRPDCRGWTNPTVTVRLSSV